MTVKFEGRIEPCIVYRVIDEKEQFFESSKLHKICAHINIEVMGWVPSELLTEIEGHPKNVFATDYRMLKNKQSN